MNTQEQGSKQRETDFDWKGWDDALRVLAIVGISSLSRYYGWETVGGFLLLILAFLLFLWLLVRSFRFLWHRFLRERWEVLSAWWLCRRKQCDYYQSYQAYGPPDLTHVGYHAGERLAIEHFVSHSGGSSQGCEVCKNWAERLRGEFWNGLMSANAAPEGPTDPILESKKRQFGFLSVARKMPDKTD
jgi:hypothetical protein